jgi:hypothetical protein
MEDTSGGPMAQFIEELCLGNETAQSFLWSFFKWSAWMDDVADQEADISPRAVGLVNMEFVAVVAGNPFFQQNREALLALMVQGMAAWVDSNEWAKRENIEHRVSADVLKGYYHEIFWHVAALCGGLEHMLAMTAKHRAFDFELCTIKHLRPEAAADSTCC